MAEADNKEVKKEDESSTSNETSNKGAFTQAEEKARGMGHRTKDEWVADGKDPDAWVDAGEFLRRAPLYDDKRKLSRTVKDLEKKLNLLYQHQDELVKAKVDKQIDELQAAKKLAAKSNDVEKVVEITDAIDELKEKAKKDAAASKPDDVSELLADFKENNKWYDENADEFDEDMFAYANGIGSKIEKDHKDDLNWDHEKILNEVAKKTKKAFEWKSKNPNRESASKVGSSKGTTTSDTPRGNGKLPTFNDLPQEAKDMYKQFVKGPKNPRGIMTSEQYLKDYAVKAGTYSEEQ